MTEIKDIKMSLGDKGSYMKTTTDKEWVIELEEKNHKLVEIQNKPRKTKADIDWLINEMFDLQMSYHQMRNAVEDYMKRWNEQRRRILELEGYCMECEGDGGFDRIGMGEEYGYLTECEACNGTGRAKQNKE